MYIKPTNDLIKMLANQGYMHGDVKSILTSPSILKSLSQYWDDLPLDQYLKNNEQFRYRRYRVFEWDEGVLVKCPVEPHYQLEAYNTVYGGLYRHYAEIDSSPDLAMLLEGLMIWVLDLIMSTTNHWRIQCHQFRVQATAQEQGQPTPEGIHQDGADFVFIMLMNRSNVKGGVSYIYNEKNGPAIYTTTLQRNEFMMLDDHRYWHSVSNLEPEDESKPAYRDVLVMTFHRL
ncbi:MAG TPA: hypothetical protein EYH35_03765 [Thiotrichaceae bacterium]|nr:hypothetical protein [Thiotrichaceae bacterium]